MFPNITKIMKNKLFFNDFKRENYLAIKKLSAFFRGMYQKIMTIFIV